MTEEKKFYWLRLQKDFFKRHDVRIIESLENGKDYIIFYLKLLVESVSHEGRLRFSETVPYDEKMLAIVTNTNVDIVRSALIAFESLGMVTILDDQTIYMNEVENMIGSVTQDFQYKESARIRMKNYRERKKLEKQEQNEEENVIVTQQLRNSDVNRYGELEIELEIEKDNNNIYSQAIDEIISYLNMVCSTHYQASTPKTRTLIKARLKEKFTVDDFKKVIDNKHSAWKGTDMEKYLRPETLFGTKFEGYLNEKPVTPKKKMEYERDIDFDALDKKLRCN